MKKSIIKNVIIGALLATCAVLTVRLWFGGMPLSGLFPVAEVAAAGGSAVHPMAQHMIESASLGVASDGDYRLVQGYIGDEYAWRLADAAIRGLITAGTHSHNGQLADFVPPALHIAVKYNFTMPTNFFRMFFGQRAGFLSSVFAGFEELLIAPDADVVTFYFLDNTNGNFHAFVLADGEIAADLMRFLDEPFFGHHSIVLDVIIAESPIGELRRAVVQDFTSFFFPNPNAIVASTINNVYTYRDNFRVVKFYPDNIVEYSAPANRGAGAVSFTASFLAALDMVNRDRAAMVALGAPMNAVTFMGYTENDGRFTFYFDYTINGAKFDLGERFYPLRHAIEIDVASNTVVRYRRLMLNFIPISMESNAYEY